MAFNLRSGNKSSFKSMGSSPLKETPTMSTSTKKKQWYVDNYEKNKDKPGYQEAMDKAFGGKTKMEGKTSITKKSPATQRLKKGGEAQDENKIFNNKGEHIGNWVNDKKVMFNDKLVKSDAKPVPKKTLGSYKWGEEIKKKKSPTKQKKGKLKYLRSGDKYIDLDKGANMPVKRKGFGPSTAFGGSKNPELTKTNKPFSKKVMKDGPKNTIHMQGGDKVSNWQPHQFRSPAKQAEKKYKY